MTYHDLYVDTVEKLRRAGIEEPETDTKRLIEKCFGLSLSQQILSSHKVINASKLSVFNCLVRRRQNREPLQYIFKKCEFWSLDFRVSPDVLIPRKETEFLLHHALSILENSVHDEKIIDMCTGSGVIAVVLASELQSAQIIAVDKSIKALNIARKNISLNGKNELINLICSDLFAGLKQTRKFTTLIANPPYIAAREMKTLQPEIRDWEPNLALESGESGLDIITRIYKQTPAFLIPKGWIFLEIGAEQGAKVYELFSQKLDGSRTYKNIDIINDWSGRARVLQAQLT